MDDTFILFGPVRLEKYSPAMLVSSLDSDQLRSIVIYIHRCANADIMMARGGDFREQLGPSSVLSLRQV